MDEIVMTLQETGAPRRTWWVGSGMWWLMVEGFGLVDVFEPTQGTY